MNISNLLNEIRRIEATGSGKLLEASKPVSAEMRALLKQRRQLKAQLNQLEIEIVNLEQKERTSSWQSTSPNVINVDKALSELWRKHFELYQETVENQEMGRDEDFEKLNKRLMKLEDNVAKTYGQQMANDMNKHSDMLSNARGQKQAMKAREFRASHGVSDEIFDPNGNFTY
jgi:hypothetical protein